MEKMQVLGGRFERERVDRDVTLAQTNLAT